MTGGTRSIRAVFLACSKKPGEISRRPELVALRVEDLTEVPGRFRVLNRRSKTDQTGEGQEIVIPRGAKIRPVQAVQEWLLAAGITEGLLFRVVWRGGHVKPRALRGADVAVIVSDHVRQCWRADQPHQGAACRSSSQSQRIATALSTGPSLRPARLAG
jgi:hypothetical protein